jgi:hypothetical protein
MPEMPTTGATPEDQTTAGTAKSKSPADPDLDAERDGIAADAGPRVSRARARTVPARPEPAPEAMPSAESAFAATAVTGRGSGQNGANGSTGSAGSSATDREGVGPTAPTSVAGPATAGASTDAEVVRGAIGRLDARSVTVTQGAVGAARAESLSLDMSAVGAAAAGEVTLSRSIARAVLAGEVHLEQAAAQTILADRVTMASGSTALVVFARRVEGEVRPLLDWRGGVALGVAMGVVLAIFRPRRRRD